MEALKAAVVPDGEEQMSSAQVVAKVLTEDSSKSNTFLKNAASSTERDLREQLEAERRAKAALEEQLATLKKKSEVTEENLAKAQRQLDETTKTAEETQRRLEQTEKTAQENNIILRRFLRFNGNSS
ncbi:hypothetical protein PVAP13_9NG333700 [Panicum virgatum]|uniref:Uncharacterized protein n=1 Tax=Panicum virgatum TaxID=38727 RepID=A0A8T0MNT0_PANVG|nr:hypothetical protein PVAP13_9NG333700 [Panicum virgatum]